MRCPNCHTDCHAPRVLRILERLLPCLFPERINASIIISTGKVETMSFSLTRGATKSAALSLTDANGVFQPLPSGIVPVWAADPPLVTLTPAADGLSCSILGGDTDGAFKLTAITTYADGDVVNAEIDGTVVDPEDTQGVITVV